MVAYRQIIQQEPSAAILSIHVAESLATTIGSARQAAAAFPNHDIRLVDCQSVSLGQGLIVHEAARMIAEAMSLNATVERLKVIRDRLSVYVVLDTLQYLARGGRVRTSQQLIADFLNIKPILSVQSGEVKPFSQERNRERALDRLYELAREACQKQPDVVMACMHADCEADMHRMTARVRQDINPAVVLQGEICPAVGVQTGPGALGLAWITEAEHVATRLQETRTSAIMDVLR
jgi:DegV family protein with EDD domain